MAVVSGRMLGACRPVDMEDLVSFPSSGRGHSVSFCRRRGPTMRDKEGESCKAGVPRAVRSVNVVSDTETARTGVVDVGFLVSEVSSFARKMFRRAVERSKSWGMSRKQAEVHIERGIINCRLFTLFSVAGSLMGSILCFVEGCFLVLESFRSTWQRSEEGEVVKLLIEALDMFLVGTAMLVFGLGIYMFFVSSKEVKGKEGVVISGSNFLGLFHLKRLPPWMETGSVEKAKLRIGHSVTLMLQAGVLEKFKDLHLVTGLDLACFAGAVLVSSACVFLLSRLSMDAVKRCRDNQEEKLG